MTLERRQTSGTAVRATGCQSHIFGNFEAGVQGELDSDTKTIVKFI